jgi:hypothetical protein
MSASPAPQLDVCSLCGKMYPRIELRLCRDCGSKEPNRFKLVRDYLRDNPGRSINDIADHTGVSRGEISKYYEEKRLVDVDPGPGDVPLECVCPPGVTAKNEMCPYCRMQLSKRLSDLQDSIGKKNESKSVRVQYLRRAQRLGDT